MKPCYDELVKRLNYASKTVSKQTNENNWIVIYDRRKLENADHKFHFLPNIQRKRIVSLSSGKIKNISMTLFIILDY